MSACFACGGMCAEEGTATHPYMLSSPGCWAAFGAVLAREYEDPALFAAVHRLSVDAYALQHPGAPSDPRATRSVWTHYMALRLAMGETSHATITAAMPRLAALHLPPLPAPPRAFAMTVADVAAAREDHAPAARRWAECALTAWSALREPADRLLHAAGLFAAGRST